MKLIEAYGLCMVVGVLTVISVALVSNAVKNPASVTGAPSLTNVAVVDAKGTQAIPQGFELTNDDVSGAYFLK